jgi:hypothetical protein
MVDVIGAEPEMVVIAYHSMRGERIIPSVRPQIFVDQILTSLGKLTVPIIQ